MPYESDDYLSRHIQTSGVDLTSKIDELSELATPPSSPNLKLYREMLGTVVRMAQADRNRWDAKIMLQTLREMENAFSRLEQFKRRRKVTVFGSARTPADHPVYQLARELGATLAKHNLMVITGAGGGIMAAAHEGAGLENSLGFNITLPFEQGANATVQGSNNLLSFHFFFLRKLFFVKEADGMVLCPGGFGTLDEALEVLTLIQTGKSPMVPVVLLDQPGGTFWSSALTFMQSQLQDNGYILPSDMYAATKDFWLFGQDKPVFELPDNAILQHLVSSRLLPRSSNLAAARCENVGRSAGGKPDWKVTPVDGKYWSALMCEGA